MIFQMFSLFLVFLVMFISEYFILLSYVDFFSIFYSFFLVYLAFFSFLLFTYGILSSIISSNWLLLFTDAKTVDGWADTFCYFIEFLYHLNSFFQIYDHIISKDSLLRSPCWRARPPGGRLPDCARLQQRGPRWQWAPPCETCQAGRHSSARRHFGQLCAPFGGVQPCGPSLQPGHP